MYQALQYNLRVPSGERPLIHNTYQLYLKDGLERLKFDYEFLMSMNDKSSDIHNVNGENVQNVQSWKVKHGVKLVRGAYMQSESKRCETVKNPYPFNRDIQSTHDMYHSAVDFTLNKIVDSDTMAGVIASHNPDTLVYATGLMRQYGLVNSDTRVLFAQLYGMGDSLTMALANNEFNIAKYVPFGPVHEVLPYLSRRLVENSAILGGSSMELKRLKSEITKRMSWN